MTNEQETEVANAIAYLLGKCSIAEKKEDAWQLHVNNMAALADDAQNRRSEDIIAGGEQSGVIVDGPDDAEHF